MASLARTDVSLARIVSEPSRPIPYRSFRGPVQDLHDEHEVRVWWMCWGGWDGMDVVDGV